MLIGLDELMERSGVKFGTSGARGRADAMTDRVCFAYTKGFLQSMPASGDLPRAGKAVAVAGDLRPSTGRIMEAVCRAAEDFGWRPVGCGRIPSPAVALFGLTEGIPAIMVTGSHIPDDRNGIKFNKPSGEILKADEQEIRRQVVELDDALFDAAGAFVRPASTPRPVDSRALDGYEARYRDAFPPDCLAGLRLGVYQHSAVGRDTLERVLRALGAAVTSLGRSDRFLPVDTEAIREEDAAAARQWAAGGAFDAIVSTDGDSDRPLLSDECGEWLRGDVAGVLCARYLDADSVSTPVSSNTLVERCGWFGEVRRTPIRSPYVIASMLEAAARGARRVVGYEANGGFLLQSDLVIGGRPLRALPTRDALILIVSVLCLARREHRVISQLVGALPQRFTASDRLQRFPTAWSQAILGRFATGDGAADRRAFEAVFGSLLGAAAQWDRTDGLRVTSVRGEILHLRPSGNAPELRCYAEADTASRAQALVAAGLERFRALGPEAANPRARVA